MKGMIIKMYTKNAGDRLENGCHDKESYGVRVSNGSVIIRVYAPHADKVTVCGDFNSWDVRSYPLTHCGEGGWWQISLPREQFPDGTRYKFAITTAGKIVLKRDPYAFASECDEGGASVFLTAEGFPWTDGNWLSYREKYRVGEDGAPYSSPINIYQMDLASWQRRDDGGYLGYREIADRLSSYIRRLGYTHVEFISVPEYVGEGSGERRTVSYFAPSSRFGTPYDFCYLVNKLHESGIGVILECSMARFAVTEGGLSSFDGTELYEYSEAAGEDGTARFDLSKREVRRFLTAAAEYWIEKYHVDGISADTVYPTDNFGIYEPRGSAKVADYAEFYSSLNRELSVKYPSVITVAEGGFPDLPLTADQKRGGLGFGLKRNMDWAKDILDYISIDPVFRKYYHGKLTYPMVYAYGDRFVLSVSRELFENAPSLMSAQFGDTADKLRGMRIFQMYAMAYPGKKLSFMGSEFGQLAEWDGNGQLEWFRTETAEHGGLTMFTAALNEFYLKSRALWGEDFSWDGFRWILPDEAEHNLIAFERRGADGERLICAVNFSGVDIVDYLLSLPDDTPYPDASDGARVSDLEWEVAFASDDCLRSNTVRVNGGRMKISLPQRSAIYLIPKRNEIF